MAISLQNTHNIAKNNILMLLPTLSSTTNYNVGWHYAIFVRN